MTLVSRLLSIAHQHHPAVSLDLGEWVAHPLIVNLFVVKSQSLLITFFQLEPWQTNGYDCGVWVLAEIMAVLQGFHLTGLQEDDMESF
jgi:hypothetical protein